MGCTLDEQCTDAMQMIGRPLASTAPWNGPAYTRLEESRGPWPEEHAAKRLRRSGLDERAVAAQLPPQGLSLHVREGDVSRPPLARRSLPLEQACPVKRRRLCEEDLVEGFRQLQVSSGGLGADKMDTIQHQLREESKDFGDRDSSPLGSTFSWGDLSNLPVLEPVEGLAMDLELQSSTGSRHGRWIEEAALQVWGSRSPASCSTALVPYRPREVQKLLRDQTEAAAMNRMLHAWGLLPSPVRVPQSKITVEQLTVRGEKAFALPDLAVPHRNKPGVKEVAIPWERELSIVLYRGAGCNLEPTQQTESVSRSQGLAEKFTEADSMDTV
ncbi:unnamed protein product [Polarella glacialis]|uniref:Uncharacterized protein n=1 Tax=Polarella glacialis TaxID=89957 RepID=A0A813L1Y9_POLGL|nr:unnamed protein product [Polarella glacialis]